MEKSNEQLAIKASLITVYVNIGLSALKLFAGIIGNSTAMIADALHSLSDLLTTAIVMIGVKLANRKADNCHPFGHERFECVTAILLSAILVATGAGIGWAGLSRILNADFSEPVIPGVIALVAAIITLAVKSVLYLYKRGVAVKINSGALLADAWHHLSDALSSVGSFLGILGARLGFPILDPLAAIVICLFIFKVAFDIFKDAVGKMTDKACDDATEAKMREVILSQESVAGVDALRTRLFGDKAYVEVEVAIDGSSTLYNAHEISHAVHDAIENEFPQVKHCTVHANPSAGDL